MHLKKKLSNLITYEKPHLYLMLQLNYEVWLGTGTDSLWYLDKQEPTMYLYTLQLGPNIVLHDFLYCTETTVSNILRWFK